jgi:hypothetical protein
MTLGTASDMRDFGAVLKEATRILEPGGRFLFSFYNQNALLYEWKYLPWQISLSARVNLDDHCLDVQHGAETYQVYARPYTTDEMSSLFGGMSQCSVVTYPTMSSVLPNEAFVGQPSERLLETVQAIDRQLSFGHNGAYIVVSGRK